MNQKEPSRQFAELGLQSPKTVHNIIADLPSHLPEELTQTLLQTSNLRIERIISHGRSSPSNFWYDQEEDEWVIVLTGSAKLQFKDRSVDMKPGDYIHIRAHQQHRVQWTTPDEPTVWLAIFFKGTTKVD
jgi:cupin 2 domain-containing protein